MNKGAVLVTGANGFLGKTILSQLLREKLTASGTDLESAPAAVDIAYKKADITRPEEVIHAIGKAATVIHAAGLAHIFNRSKATTTSFKAINEQGTANVAQASAKAGVSHFVLISSVSVYGPITQGAYGENMPCRPQGPYAKSKYQAELRAIEIAKASGMALTILRLATLYGEEDPGNVGRLMRTIDRGRFLWIGEGMNRKSLLYKVDAARACQAVATRPAYGVSVYNVSAPSCTMRAIVDGLAMALERKPLPGRIPASIALLAGKALSRFPYKRLSGLQSTIEKWLGEDVYNTIRFETDYGFHAEVELMEGLEREVYWYRQSQGRKS